MTRDHGHDRLLPVLGVLVSLLSATIAVEIYARGHEAPDTVIAIHGAAESLEDEAEGGEAGADVAPDPHAPVNARHEEARQLARRGEIDRALALFAEVVAAHADSAEVHDDYGYWLLVADRYPEARAEFERALAIRPDDALALLNLGTVHLRTDRPRDAERRYREALAARPSYGRARMALASLLLERGEAAEAARVVRRATESGSNSERARALRILGDAQLSLGQRENAERSFASAIERAPAEAELRVRIASAYLRAHGPGDTDRAVAILHEALSIAPDVASVQYAAGRALERVGDDEGAERAHRRALAIDPGHRVARRRLLRLALDRRDYRQARSHAQHLLGEDASNPEHHFLAALVEARDGNLDEARTHYAAAIESRAEYPEAWFNLGLLEKGAGQLEAAIAAYRRAIELRPDYRAAWNNLGLALAAAGHVADAEAAYVRATEVDGPYPAALLNLAMLRSAGGRQDDAVATLRRAIELKHGDYPAAELDLGVVLERAGRRQDALRVYRSLTERHPRYARAFHNLGDALRADRKPREAEAAYAQALALDPERTSTRLALARAVLDRGDLAAASSGLRDVLDRDPRNVDARLALGELERRSGRSTECARQARFVLADDARNEAARRLLGSCGSETAPSEPGM